MSLSLLLGLAGPALAYDAGSVNQATTLSWGGSRYYAAVDTQGNLWMWGSNSYYQMGTGVGAEVEVPVKILDGVADVNAHIEYADAFISVRNVVSLISLALIIILIIVSFFIMSNTIKLATFTRREEIAIMRMVGASNGFIRCPFIIEGLVLGVLGGLLAFIIEWGLYSLLLSRVSGVASTLITLVPFSGVMWPLLLFFLGVGVIVGVSGGSSAIRNYLKV